jgi:hypothetical protein
MCRKLSIYHKNKTTFSKSQGTKLIHTNQLHFLHANNEQSKKKIQKNKSFLASIKRNTTKLEVQLNGTALA